MLAKYPESLKAIRWVITEKHCFFMCNQSKRAAFSTIDRWQRAAAHPIRARESDFALVCFVAVYSYFAFGGFPILQPMKLTILSQNSSFAPHACITELALERQINK